MGLADEARPKNPSTVVVLLSGGKDCLVSLDLAVKEYGPQRIIGAHQYIPEDWPITVEQCQRLCDFYGIPLFVQQTAHSAMLCQECGNQHVSVDPDKAWCHACGSRHTVKQHDITGIHQLVEWRGRYPDLQNHFCSSTCKRDVFNRWIREQGEERFGSCPLVISGERSSESTRRALLPELCDRGVVRAGWMLQHRNILRFSRQDVFCTIRDKGLPLSPIYMLYWQEMLQLELEDWHTIGKEPHCSYPGQWQSLYHYEQLPQSIMNEMIETLMYRVNEESHGPRYACQDCYLLSPLHHRAAFRLARRLHIPKPAHEEALEIEEKIHFRMTKKYSLREMLATEVTTIAEEHVQDRSAT